MTEKCPVCKGRGMVEKGFYPDDETTEYPECRACDGKGIVRWGDAIPAPTFPVPFPVPYPQPYPVPVPTPRPLRPVYPWWDNGIRWTVSGGSVTYQGPETHVLSAVNG